MNDIPHEKIIIGELIEGHAERKTLGKRLFSLAHLNLLNKATLRRRNGRHTDFYWLPHCDDSPYLCSNKWAVESVYSHGAIIQNTCGWTFGNDIRGLVIIKRQEHLMPCVTIGARSPREETLLETAKHTMMGFWHITESPLSDTRKLFAENVSDIIRGKMLFSRAV